MAKVDLHFANGSHPALNADNMNKIVDAVNTNDDEIKNVRDDLTEIIEQKIPESIVADIVDDYVEEHQAGLEPKAREMTKSQFDALSDEEKKGTIHVSDEYLDNDLINDSVVSGSKTWSSQKINEKLGDLPKVKTTAWSKVTTNGTTKQEVWRYTANKDCFVSLMFAVLWNAGQPTGVSVTTNSIVRESSDWKTILVDDTDTLHTKVHCVNAYLKAGKSLVISEKIVSNNGTFSGDIAYVVNENVAN